MSASSSYPDAAEGGFAFIDRLGELTGHRDIKQFLNSALRETLQAVNSEAGSLLFLGDQSLMVREGDLSPEVESQISLWEDGLTQRLKESSLQIRERESLPITTHVMEKTRRLLVNTPLLQDRRLTGSLTAVFPPGQSLSLSKRQALASCARIIGNLARTIEELAIAQSSLNQLTFLCETSRALVSTLDVTAVLENTMQLATRVLNASASTLMLLDEDTKELVFEIPHGEKRDVLTSYRMPMHEGIAGWVATHGTPALVNDVHQDDRFSDKVDAWTGFLTQSVICAPLQIKERTIGVLELLNKISEPGFTDDDLRLLSTLAAQAGIAIENARLYRSLREERDRIIRIQEEARHELARDLHDSTVQSLAAIAMNIDYIRGLVEHEPESAAERLDELHETVTKASRETRTLLFELRPIILGAKGLVPTLETYVEQLQEEGSPIFHFNDGGFDKRLSDKVEATTFIIVQEAINNARKHAKARNIWLNLAEADEHLLVAVEDDGRGFDLEKTREAYDQHSRLGLLSMQERADLVDGQLSVQSKLDKGTKITLRVPLSPPAEQP